MKVTKYKLLTAAWIAGCVLMIACPSARELTRLDDMTQPTYEAYVTSTAVKVGAIAQAMKDEGDLSPEAAKEIADILRSVGSGTLSGALMHSGNLSGYEGLAITLALNELDAAMAERGAYDTGLVSERAAGVLLAVAQAIDPQLKDMTDGRE